MSTSTLGHAVNGNYRHEAFFYGDDDEYMDGTLGFIREAVAADEPILVVLGAPRIDGLRRELGGDAEGVLFADMAAVGANPARIIPAWQDFLVEQGRPGRRLRGIGEPIWASRSPAELAECQRHEALLNVAFADPDFWLLCPYDTSALDDAVIDEARRTHPFVRDANSSSTSTRFPGHDTLAEPFDRPLPEPASEPAVLTFRHESLREVRSLTASIASRAGLSESRTADLVLAVSEISTNSVKYGGGRGALRVWLEGNSIICEVRDAGRLTKPLLGRIRPGTDADGGRGLWLANQLCDLVQLRSFDAETVARLHMRTV